MRGDILSAGSSDGLSFQQSQSNLDPGGSCSPGRIWPPCLPLLSFFSDPPLWAKAGKLFSTFRNKLHSIQQSTRTIWDERTLVWLRVARLRASHCSGERERPPATLGRARLGAAKLLALD